ncbi:MAG: hypothetical protein E3J66_04795 [Dehalococcoidia bacterium]|nr:MAG: hypothetical protein E3J66_04795 [Dehalococcoidia bacterium]
MMQINVSLNLNLGKRLVQVGDKVLGVCDGVTINVTQATPEECIELQKAQEIKLIKPNREELT